MLNPNTRALVADEITVAKTAEEYTAITDLEGAVSVTLVARFVYGSGGTTCAAIVQTSFDGGTVWYDIARFDFTTASGTKVCNLNANLSKAVGAYSALSVEGVNDSILGPDVRAVVTSTGTYAGGTSLAVRACFR